MPQFPQTPPQSPRNGDTASTTGDSNEEKKKTKFVWLPECGICATHIAKFVCAGCIQSSVAVKRDEWKAACVRRDETAEATLRRIRRHVDALAFKPEMSRVTAEVESLKASVAQMRAACEKEKRTLKAAQAALAERAASIERRRQAIGARARAAEDRVRAEQLDEARQRLSLRLQEVAEMRRIRAGDLLAVFPVRVASESHSRILTIALPNHGDYSSVTPEHLSAAMCHGVQVVFHLSRILDVWIPQDYRYTDFCGVDGNTGFVPRPFSKISVSIAKLNAAVAALCASQGCAVRGSVAVAQTLKNIVACTSSPLLGRDGPFSTYLKIVSATPTTREYVEAPIESLEESEDETLDGWETVDTSEVPHEEPSSRRGSVV